MNIAAIQAALNARGTTPPLKSDGVPGKKTMAAVDLALTLAKVDADDWSDARRLIAIEQLIYADDGIEVGLIDGLIGEQTRYARTVYVARLTGNTTVETWRDAENAKPPPVPPQAATVWPRQNGVESFFGVPGTNHARFDFPFPMRLAWNPAQAVTWTSVNKKVLAPLQRIWSGALGHYGHERLKRLRLDLYGGCYNNRNMRGGAAKSMHAYAIAWDIDPDRNQLKWGRDLASLDAADYEPFWKLVEAEGAISLGRVRNFDWMHFQFARL
jgi:hypothetical protein